jgi:hypothetical protein
VIKYHATFMFFYEFCQVQVSFMLTHYLYSKGLYGNNSLSGDTKTLVQLACFHFWFAKTFH